MKYTLSGKEPLYCWTDYLFGIPSGRNVSHFRADMAIGHTSLQNDNHQYIHKHLTVQYFAVFYTYFIAKILKKSVSTIVSELRLT